MKKSTANTSAYTWGDNCKGWPLLEEPTLRVIEEEMPPGTAEQLHYHEKAVQIFYILEGQAEFQVDEETIQVTKGESLHITAGKKHRIRNTSNQTIRFLVISAPTTIGDRVNL
jgi:quercetin dioxygenase-like cupin family protein